MTEVFEESLGGLMGLTYPKQPKRQQTYLVRNTPFFPSCPGKGEVVISRISPWLQPFASSSVGKESSPSSDQLIAAARRGEEFIHIRGHGLIKFSYL